MFENSFSHTKYPNSSDQQISWHCTISLNSHASFKIEPQKILTKIAQLICIPRY